MGYEAGSWVALCKKLKQSDKNVPKVTDVHTTFDGLFFRVHWVSHGRQSIAYFDAVEDANSFSRKLTNRRMASNEN